MPELVACPQCERKLKVPDTLLGKRVKCPGCQTTFTAAAAAKAAPAKPAPRRPMDDDDDDGPQQYEIVTSSAQAEEEKDSAKGLLEKHFHEQRIEDERSKRGKRPFTENWRKARMGIRLLALACFILVMAHLTQLAGRGIIWVVTRPEELEPNPNPRQKQEYENRLKTATEERKEKGRYLTGAVAIIFLVYQVVALAGIGICLLAPEKDNLRLLPIPALLLALGSLGLEIALSLAPLQYLTSGVFDPATGMIPAPHPGLKIATDLVGYLRNFAFLFFLRAVGKSTKSEDLAREVLMLIFFMPLATLFWLIMASLAAAKLPAELPYGIGAVAIEGSVIGVIGLCSFGVVMASVVWLMMTLYTTTLSIADWLYEKR